MMMPLCVASAARRGNGPGTTSCAIRHDPTPAPSRYSRGMLRRAATSVIFALSVLAAPAATAPAIAQDLMTGLMAAERGDFATALRELPPLAEQGNAAAQASLAALYALGRGVPVDIATALRWYRLAAGQGHTAAQYNLGQLLRSRQSGALRDPAEAMTWYRRAADQGHIEAHYKLGLMHANGAAGTQDFILAHLHWTLAEKFGFDTATDQLDSLMKLMTEADIAEAKQLAEAWMVAYGAGPDEVTRLRRTLAERQAEISQLRQTLVARTNEAVALGRSIADLDRKIADLRIAAEQRAENVAALPATTPVPSPETASVIDRVAAKDRHDASPTLAAPKVSDGVAAYHAADYARAFEIWQPLAKTGDVAAQFYLGALYYEGRGVARDLVEARHWLGIAAWNGSMPAKALLETIQ